MRRELQTQKKRFEKLRYDPTRNSVSEEEHKIVKHIILLNYQEEIMWNNGHILLGSVRAIGIQTFSSKSKPKKS